MANIYLGYLYAEDESVGVFVEVWFVFDPILSLGESTTSPL